MVGSIGEAHAQRGGAGGSGSGLGLQGGPVCRPPRCQKRHPVSRPSRLCIRLCPARSTAGMISCTRTCSAQGLTCTLVGVCPAPVSCHTGLRVHSVICCEPGPVGLVLTPRLSVLRKPFLFGARTPLLFVLYLLVLSNKVD